jgi:hypothetical protein
VSLADFGSFYPIWCTAIHRTTGPIFEMGCGDYSTHVTHFMGKDRLVISADTDKSWLDRYQSYANHNHQFYLIEKGLGANDYERWRDGWIRWIKSLSADLYFGCALIDGAPGEVRQDVVKALRVRCKFFVLHDTEELDINGDDGGNYGWPELVPTFKYAYTWRPQKPWTTVVSDVEEFIP